MQTAPKLERVLPATGRKEEGKHHLVVVLEALDGPGLQTAGLERPDHFPFQRLVDVVVVADHRVVASSLHRDFYSSWWKDSRL